MLRLSECNESFLRSVGAQASRACSPFGLLSVSNIAIGSTLLKRVSSETLFDAREELVILKTDGKGTTFSLRSTTKIKDFFQKIFTLLRVAVLQLKNMLSEGSEKPLYLYYIYIYIYNKI